jgi:crotonobetainyl-CoA:carnitine CoA-transferase CaiB-like acyl-CoA transferase
MQEAAYATLTSQLHAYIETGEVPQRTGNGQPRSRAIDAYSTNDGYQLTALRTCGLAQ